MTANRVITDHGELDGIGQLTHDQLDAYVRTSPFLVVSGSAGSRPPASRGLVAGTGVTITDGGAGGDMVIASTATGGTVTLDRVVWTEPVSGSCDGLNTVFAVSRPPTPSGSLMLFVNGIMLAQGPSADYVAAGASVSIFTAPPIGSNVVATYPYATGSNTVSWAEAAVGTTDGSNVSFLLSGSPAPDTALMLFVNGELMSLGDDFSLSGNAVTLVVPPPAASDVLATYPTDGLSLDPFTWNEPLHGSVDGTNDTFSLARAPWPTASLMLFVNGMLMSQGNDYLLEAGTVLLALPPPIGSNVVATYQFSQASPLLNDCIDVDEHRKLRQLIHFMDGGPGDGFYASPFRERSGYPFVTRLTWWDSPSRGVRLFQKELTRSIGGSFLVTTMSYKMYDPTGNLLVTATDVLTYASGVFESTRTRTFA